MTTTAPHPTSAPPRTRWIATTACWLQRTRHGRNAEPCDTCARDAVDLVTQLIDDTPGAPRTYPAAWPEEDR